MAMPMSASCRAGPSLTPSPVIATTWPRERSARAMRSLSSGDTRAITTPSRSTMRREQGLVGGQVGALEDGVVGAAEPHLVGDGRGGARVVPGNHRHPDARARGNGDAVHNVGPGRVLERQKPIELQAVLGILGGTRRRLRRRAGRRRRALAGRGR